MENGKATILHFPVLDSTNSFALEYGSPRHLLTVVADSQTAGRGRMGRSFLSPDSGLYMSVILDPERIRCPLSLCTPAAALAVKDALEENGIKGLRIKWVNDILLEGRKVCGILTQMRSENGRNDRIVIGIGINLREWEEGFPEEIRDTAGYVDFRGNKLSLAESITAGLDKYICADGADICGKYNSCLAFLGETATVTDYADGNRKICGTVLGTDERCFLRIRAEDGTERLVSSGEIE